MARPAVFSVPVQTAFADALAAGLLRRTGGDPLALARTQLLLPNRRAARAMTEAFVRACGTGGLLLPRMHALGDLAEEEALAAFEDAGAALPPAADPTARRLRLIQLIRSAQGEAMPVLEALRLADQLARAFDLLAAYEAEPTALRGAAAAAAPELAGHWQSAMALFEQLAGAWPAQLAVLQAMDAAARRGAVLSRLAKRWRTQPPEGLVVAAGMLSAPPAIARLLGVVARLERGLVVLPGLDLAMGEAEWDAIACRLTAPDEPQESEEHPQFGFKCLLARMGVARGEVADWGETTPRDGPPARAAIAARAMSAAAFTRDWPEVAVDPTAFADVRTIEAATPAEEAQAIALALRRSLETPEATAALVTPDRGLARRVAAQLGRWGIDIDDSAGVPLRAAPPGTLLLALTEAAAERFAPVELLALLKHPLVGFGAERGVWLRQVRALDLALRGVRPRPGLGGIAERLAEYDAGSRKPPLAPAWAPVAARLAPLEAVFVRPRLALGELVEALRTAGEALCGEALWAQPAGRAASELVADLAAHGDGLAPFEPADAPPLLAALLAAKPVRPAYGKHPRLAIYGLIEARLQRADLTILGGLNEGVWPAAPAPDPWLAPRIRALLGLPSPHGEIGLAAHDFLEAIGGKAVLLSRARRDASAPTVPSRLWLRLHALAGDALRPDDELLGWARAIDAPAAPPRRAERPAPAPPAALRPRRLVVTRAEMLKADPFSFYAREMLRLRPLDELDADPTTAERGIDVHEILEKWVKGDDHSPERLHAISAEVLAKWGNHPLMAALWVPRVARAMDWAADELESWRAEGWSPRAAEAMGRLVLPSGITLEGRADRIDVDADERLAIIDYKTGNPPSRKQVKGGSALQMGLLGALAERGAFAERVGPARTVAAFRYWKLSGGRNPGKAHDPLVSNRTVLATPTEHIAATWVRFERLCEAYLLGDAPFLAKAHPDYATRYRDFDHLARVDEWLGRPPGADA